MGSVAPPKLFTELAMRADQSNLTLTALPAAFDFLDTSARSIVGPIDLSGYSQCQLIYRKQTVSGVGNLVLAFSLVNAGSTFVSGDWTQSLASCTLVGANLNIASGWVQIPNGFITPATYIQVLQGNGDGVASPVIGFVKAYIR